jgi:hypothetical protein
VKLGVENRKQMIAAAALGVVLVLVVVREVLMFSSTNASTIPVATTSIPDVSPAKTSGAHHGSGATPGKKERPAQSLDPTLHLDQLASSEQIKYEGSGRNIFVSQADITIPQLVAHGETDKGQKDDPIYHPPGLTAPPPIPLKFFGFSNQPGEPKKAFLSKDQDIFVAGEGEIVDRRYKVVRISSTAVEIQDLVVTGPTQSIPLTQGNPT